MRLYNLLVFYFFDDTKNISPVYSILLSNFIAMTAEKEGEDRISDEFFGDCVNTLYRGKDVMRASELPGVNIFF
jgi:hypothetical protein